MTQPALPLSTARWVVAYLAMLAGTAWGNDSTTRSIEIQKCVVRYSEDVDVPALSTGRVVEVFANTNQAIDSGARVARLDDRSLLIRRRSNELKLQLARGEVEDDLELKYAETALAEAEAELDASRSIHKDYSGAVPLNQLRRLRLAVQRGELEVARAKKRRVEAGIAIDLAEAELAVIDDQLRNLHVESPLAGIVLEVKKSAGEWVQVGETVATIARMDRLSIHALVSAETLPPTLPKGLPVSVHWTDLASQSPMVLRGKVQSVDPQVLSGGVYRLHAEIINEPLATTQSGIDSLTWKLRPGSEVKMAIHLTPSVAAQLPKSSRALNR